MGICCNNSPKERISSIELDKIIEEKDELSTKYIDPIPESIKDKLYNAIVKIELINNTKKSIRATGFFMRIKVNNIEKKCLFTCKHLISDEDINNILFL